MYSRILDRASGGRSGAASIRLIIDAERPEALWLALRMVQAVLRESPSALACLSGVRNPGELTASASSLMLEDCRAFILAVSGSGRWVRACTRAAESGRNSSDECEYMLHVPLVGCRESCTRTFVRGGCREHERLSERFIVDVPRRLDRAVGRMSAGRVKAGPTELSREPKRQVGRGVAGGGGPA